MRRPTALVVAGLLALLAGCTSTAAAGDEPIGDRPVRVTTTEIAFVPFDPFDSIDLGGGVGVARAAVVLAVVVGLNLLLVGLLSKELKATTSDPGFAATVRLRPQLLSRLLLVAVAVTAVSAFEAVGAILVVTLLIVPAATAYLLTNRLVVMVAVAVGVGWVGAPAGYVLAVEFDSSIAGAMGWSAPVLRAGPGAVPQARPAHPPPAPPHPRPTRPSPRRRPPPPRPDRRPVSSRDTSACTGAPPRRRRARSPSRWT